MEARPLARGHPLTLALNTEAADAAPSPPCHPPEVSLGYLCWLSGDGKLGKAEVNQDRRSWDSAWFDWYEIMIQVFVDYGLMLERICIIQMLLVLNQLDAECIDKIKKRITKIIQQFWNAKCFNFCEITISIRRSSKSHRSCSFYGTV